MALKKIKTKWFRACKEGDLALAIKCIDHGFDINSVNEYGRTGLMVASSYSKADCVALLIAHQADIDAQADNGWTALMCASGNGSVDCVRLLIDAGANINASADGGWTPLRAAALFGQEGCIELLIKSGAMIDTKDDEKIVSIAIGHGHIESAHILVRCGADFDCLREYFADDYEACKAIKSQLKTKKAKCAMDKNEHSIDL